jgi:hypothetical protein
MGKALRYAICAAFSLAASSGCATLPDGYTCCNLHYDADRISDANWRNLPMIPAGATIRIVNYGFNTAVVEIDGKPIKIAHDYGRDQESLETYVRKLVAQEDPRARVASYSPEVREAIFRGVVIRGMTREQVLVAVGYPPTHRTFTLESNVWHPWASRHGRYEIHFDSQGTVERIVGDTPARDYRSASPAFIEAIELPQ